MKILLGVTGGIAAYKSAELVRTLQQSGVDIHVAMTASAERFITPLTFSTLTSHPVYTSIWQPASPQPDTTEIEHISAVQHIDAFVVAPATANILAKFAQGLADDVLTTAYLANTAPVLLAPAMNVNMWNHPATRANLQTLRSRSHHIVPTDSGYLACGMIGSGRLASVETITAEILNLLHPNHDLAGETILITAGGTREPIDPVRFLGNRSSGKMGHALAEAAQTRGAKVILITASSLPATATTIRVSTAQEMQAAVLTHLPEATIVIAAAAVADFRPTQVSPSKIHRTGPLTLTLNPTEDIVAAVVTQRHPDTLVIAFAAESPEPMSSLEQNARAKLLRKRADAIVANDISLPNLGFDSDSNAGLFLTPTQTISLEPASKRVFADRILNEIKSLRINALRKEPTKPYMPVSI
jgi:phosphopantothenoylcysteine decarboxylase/phosphopantothenate--cysteine ligase